MTRNNQNNRNNEAPKTNLVRQQKMSRAYTARNWHSLSVKEKASRSVMEILLDGYHYQYPSPEGFACAAMRRAKERKDDFMVWRMADRWASTLEQDKNLKIKINVLRQIAALYKERDRIPPILPVQDKTNLRWWKDMETCHEAFNRVICELDRKKIGKLDLKFAVEKGIEVGLITDRDSAKKILNDARDKVKKKQEAAKDVTPFVPARNDTPFVAKIDNDILHANKE